MLKKLALSAATALALSGGAAFAAGPGGEVRDVDFSFEGPFGRYDPQQLQRGLKVYTEICAACHGLQYVPLRTLSDRGGPMMPPDQVRAFAAELPEIFDPELDDFRARVETDHFPRSAMENAPDLSLMTKARAGFEGPYGLGINQLLRGVGGPEYLYSLLTGYTGEEKEEAGELYYENTAYGGWLAMAPPMEDGWVDFDDGADNSLHAMSMDVAAFLTWTAEPKMMARKEAGFVAVLFLVLLSSLLYLTNKRIWAPVKRKAKGY